MISYPKMQANIQDKKRIKFKDAVELPAVKFRCLLARMKKANYRWDALAMEWYPKEKRGQ